MYILLCRRDLRSSGPHGVVGEDRGWYPWETNQRPSTVTVAPEVCMAMLNCLLKFLVEAAGNTEYSNVLHRQGSIYLLSLEFSLCSSTSCLGEGPRKKTVIVVSFIVCWSLLRVFNGCLVPSLPGARSREILHRPYLRRRMWWSFLAPSITVFVKKWTFRDSSDLVGPQEEVTNTVKFELSTRSSRL